MKDDWEDRLKKDGPMYCKGRSCIEFRKREPEFAQRLQKAGIIAHYNGTTNLAWGPDEWMLSGITPIGRAGLERLISRTGMKRRHRQALRFLIGAIIFAVSLWAYYVTG